MNDIFKDFDFSGPFDSWWPFIIAISVGIITTLRCYFGGAHCPSKATIKGKTVVITGGSSGIGCQVVKELNKRGGKIIIGSRNPQIAIENIKKEIRESVIKEHEIVIKYLDLTSLKSVREFVDALQNESKIDVLINNAGIGFLEFNKTKEGFETHLVTNYLSHFYLTHLLLPKLKASEHGRIINVSAQAHYTGQLVLEDLNNEFEYNYNKAFSQSKLALVMMTRHMNKILKGANVTINAGDPGLVKYTNFYKKSRISTSIIIKYFLSPWIWLFMKTPEEGAQTIIYMAVAPELENVSGKYFSNCKITEPSDEAKEDHKAEKLYKKSLKLVGLHSE